MNYNPSELLPQKEPMRFITAIESVDFDEQCLVARVDVKDTDLLFQSNLSGVPSSAALEYMAQAIACYIGAYDMHISGIARAAVGFILGSRDLHVAVPVFLVNKSYYIRVKSLYCDTNMASFNCMVYDKENNVVATGALNAFRPDDITTFKGGKL